MFWEMQKRKISGKAMREKCEENDFLISSNDFRQSTFSHYYLVITIVFLLDDSNSVLKDLEI